MKCNLFDNELHSIRLEKLFLHFSLNLRTSFFMHKYIFKFDFSVSLCTFILAKKPINFGNIQKKKLI